MIIVATPTRDSVLAGFVFDLVNLIKRTPSCVFATATGTYLSNLRTQLVRTAIEKGCSHILFIDSDMRFPEDTVERLLKADKDIVGANCASRTQDRNTADTKLKSGLEKVDHIGFGVTMISARVFKQVPEPWFAMPFDKSEGKHVGEDIYFCEMAKDFGFEIWVDHDLSKLVKHTVSVEKGVN